MICRSTGLQPTSFGHSVSDQSQSAIVGQASVAGGGRVITLGLCRCPCNASTPAKDPRQQIFVSVVVNGICASADKHGLKTPRDLPGRPNARRRGDTVICSVNASTRVNRALRRCIAKGLSPHRDLGAGKRPYARHFRLFHASALLTHKEGQKSTHTLHHEE
jgi:hypothetical protein